MMSAINKKRVSKKSKLSWRKHVNISDVEEFLEEKRLEERLGPPLETLTNDQLFKVDTKPSEEPELSSRERKRLKLLRPPKCFALLEPHTKVPDPIQKRNRVRSKEERKNELIKKKEEENRAKGILRHKELRAIHDRKVNDGRLQSKHKRGEYNENIWNEDNEPIENEEWCLKNTVKHNLIGTGKSRKTARNPTKPKSSILPSIDLPHPGMSYNPSFDDHQDLLKIVAEKEQKIIKTEEHLNRVTKNMFRKVTSDKRDSAWLQEMSQGLPKTPTQDSEPESDGEYKSVNPPTKNKKKTLQQRRKKQEERKLQLQRKAAKVEKRKVSDLHHLKTLHKQIQKRDSKTQILREKRKKMQLLKKKEPKRLSALKFEESELEFNMGTDISGNLRNLKKEGSLLTDRFKSLQKRNVIQPSVRRHRKKVKVKVYTKPDHKDDWITTVARAV